MYHSYIHQLREKNPKTWFIYMISQPIPKKGSKNCSFLCFHESTHNTKSLTELSISKLNAACPWRVSAPAIAPVGAAACLNLAALLEQQHLHHPKHTSGSTFISPYARATAPWWPQRPWACRYGGGADQDVAPMSKNKSERRYFHSVPIWGGDLQI